jgi:hypothetical protein
MFDKMFSNAVTLQIGEQTITFNSLADFEFAISSRIEVPTRKLSQLVHMSVDELKNEAKNIKAIERKFVKILSRSIELPGAISKDLGELDPQLFTQDHLWRDIMSKLIAKDPEFEDLKKMALVKYLQYLTARQEAIKIAYMTKRASTPRLAEGEQQQSRPGTEETLPEPVQTTQLHAVTDAEGDVAPEEAETMQGPAMIGDAPFSRMAKGEALVLPLPNGAMLEMVLSKHNFKLFARKGRLELVDELGGSFPLQEGKNIIGRDSVCNVVVDAAFRDISRLHVIIERLGDQAIRLTDLSSQGTYIPSKVMRQAS